MGNIKMMFDPRTVAVLGATEREDAAGRSVLENLLLPSERKIFPVNPRYDAILGNKCYPSVTDIGEPIDLAVIITPAPTVPALVEECGEAGVEGIVILSSGFREVGAAGKELEDEITKIRERYGVRIIGPNCLGIMRPHIGLNASFLKVNPEPGNIAFISESGHLGDAILDWGTNAGIGFSMFASLGSMIDVDYGDLIDFLGDDSATRSIMIYMEHVGRAKKFLSAARGFARSKPMVVMKPGIFARGPEAECSRLAAMVGSDQVYDAAFKRVGFVRVKEVSDLFNLAKVLDSAHLPKGPRLAIVTNGGGMGTIAMDTLLSLGGELAEFSESTTEKLDEFLPPYCNKTNPLDILGEADIERFRHAIQACLEDPNMDGVLSVHSPRAVVNDVELARAIVELSKKSQKPIISARMGGSGLRDGVDFLVHNSIPTYETPEEAVKTYLYMYKYKKNLDLLYETPTDLTGDQMRPKYHLKALIRKALKEGTTKLNAEESMSFLADYGIPSVKTRVTQSVEEAVQVADDLGYPVVLKIASPDISDKMDVQGVMIGIQTERELKESYHALLERVTKQAPSASITGITVQKMLKDIDYELIISSKKDPDFGSVVLFGMGGVGADIFRDVTMGLPPLNQTLARRLIEDVAAYKMLQGYRGRPPADLRQIEQILVDFSNLLVDFPEIAEMYVSPVAISHGKAWAVDARIVLDKEAQNYKSPYEHLAITPYPSRYIAPFTLRDGTEVLLRPIRPEDEPLEHEMLTTLSEGSVRERFFNVIKGISHEMLIRFCNIDYEREMALVTELRNGEKKRIIGIGRLIIEPHFKTGQFAVLVHDDYHGKGLGYTLIDLMIGFAQSKSLEEIYGIVLSENDRMLNVCRKLGFHRKFLPDGICRVSLTLN